MTPEERARRACDQMSVFLSRDEWVALVAQEIRAAVAEEREAMGQAAREYLLCVPCPPVCSQAPGGPHVDSCAKRVAEEPGFLLLRDGLPDDA